MAWVIGIDEAGYGPNLGPFVMTSVALRVAETQVDADLWQLLQGAVRRAEDPDDGRIPVGDSKAIYSPARGITPLEQAVLSLLPVTIQDPISLSKLLDSVTPLADHALHQEPWYTGLTGLPTEAKTETLSAAQSRWANTCETSQIRLGLVRSVVLCPRHFNTLTDAADSKGAVLHHGLAELVRANWTADGEPLHFAIDKHGGRNTYSAMLQDLVPEGMIVAYQEGAARSVYGVMGVDRTIRWTFQPRADAEHFPVALASMVSKYLRELLMQEFNVYWRKHLPDLKPTAGYPVDAKRFYAKIRPLLAGLGLEEDQVWRRR